MTHIFRNPFTPPKTDRLSPLKYLQRKLYFSIWDTCNPIKHRPTCTDVAHHEVMIHGMCCIPHLQQCIEGHLLNLAGCRSGVFIEPKGFNNWLVLAQERLNELLEGRDNLDKWTRTLKEEGDEFHSWIWNTNKSVDRNLLPGFSLKSYVVACKKYGFKPDFKAVSFAFGFSEKEVLDCWNN